MPSPQVNYDAISGSYDDRYQVAPMQPVAGALAALAGAMNARRVLEVGCGTGRWLAELAAPGRQVVGLDASLGMLRGAQGRVASAGLLHGVAERLPFRAGSFDLIYTVNALHHFADKQQFIREARRVLRPGGQIAIVGMRPADRADWYIYQYFEGTYATDLARYPSPGELSGWLGSAGFAEMSDRIVHHIEGQREGRAVFDDPFIQKNSTSQLVLLSDAAYEAGWRRIEAAIEQAEAAGERIVFSNSLDLVMVTARCGLLG